MQLQAGTGGGGHGRGPALECAAGSAGRGAAYPNYLPIITTMPLICYRLQIGGIQLNSLLAKTHANHVFTWVFFLHGRRWILYINSIIQMQIQRCLTQIVVSWFYFCVDIRTQESYLHHLIAFYVLKWKWNDFKTSP